MNDQDPTFMLEALQLADQAAERGEVPVGAVVVRDGEIIARGYNLREAWQDPTAHAESIAMRRAALFLGSWRLERCTVYVTLEPCPMCAGAMVLARVHRCVFGCTDPKGGYVGTLGDLSQVSALNHQYEVTGGVLADECSLKLKTFFRQLRQKSS